VRPAALPSIASREAQERRQRHRRHRETRLCACFDETLGFHWPSEARPGAFLEPLAERARAAPDLQRRGELERSTVPIFDNTPFSVGEIKRRLDLKRAQIARQWHRPGHVECQSCIGRPFLTVKACLVMVYSR